MPAAAIAATLILALPAAEAVAGPPPSHLESAGQAALPRPKDHPGPGVQLAEAAPPRAAKPAAKPVPAPAAARPRATTPRPSARPAQAQRPGTHGGAHRPAPPAEAPSPYTVSRPHLTGVASYYARHFNGRRMANGQAFDPHSDTIAHRTLPFGTRVRITNLANGRSVYGTVRDRGPYARGRLLDVSPRIAGDLGMLHSGLATVSVWRAGGEALEIAEAQ